MRYLIQAPSGPALPTGQVTLSLPASKSLCNRLLLMNALAPAPQPIHNLSDCQDTTVMVQALQSHSHTIDVGAAGTAMRFLTAYYAMQEGQTHILTGSERMKQRPIGILVEALRQLGADITYQEKEGYPPMLIKGCRLRGGALTIDGSVSSQYISALLMLAPCLDKGLHLTLQGHIASRPYIDMTLQLMQRFGVAYTLPSESEIVIPPAPYAMDEVTVESDWSAASYAFEIVALAACFEQHIPTIQLQHLLPDSLQGDRAVQKLFGQYLRVVQMQASGQLTALDVTQRAEKIQFDFSGVPDLAQTLVVTCCLLDIPFEFTGLESLYIKETNRIEALITELRKLGYVLEDVGTGVLTWNRTYCQPEDQPVIATYKDHRMAMAFAPCCLKRGSLLIDDPGVVSKSFPGYWDELRKLGFVISEIQE